MKGDLEERDRAGRGAYGAEPAGGASSMSSDAMFLKQQLDNKKREIDGLKEQVKELKRDVKEA